MKLRFDSYRIVSLKHLTYAGIAIFTSYIATLVLLISLL